MTAQTRIATPASDRGACPAGGGEACDLAPLGAFPDLSGRVGAQEVRVCRRCGMGISLPAIADPSFLYEDRDSQDFQPEAAGLERAIKRVFFTRQARKLLAQLPPDARNGLAAQRGRLLDFGCGSGLFTRCLGDILGPRVVTGADFHDAAPPELADRPYLGMAALPTATASFDVVQASHVLEHDDDAAALLARITAMVRPGGVLVLEVPDIDCAWARICGPAWGAWYLPYHRTHFSRASLVGLIERAGLRVEAVHDICVPMMGRTLANRMGRRNNLFFVLAGAALHPLQWLVEKVGHTPSALRVVARKPS